MTQDAAHWSPAARAWAAAVSVVLVVLVLVPAFVGKDGFPLSNYPMFSQPKGTSARVYHVLGISSRGEHRPLPPEAVGTDEIMQAYQTVKLASRRGPVAAAEFCTRTAEAVRGDEEFADLEALQVRIDTFDAVAYWGGDRKPRKAVVVATCEVPRG